MIIVTTSRPTVSDVVTVTAAGGLTVTHEIMRVVSDGGDVNITANPQISPGTKDGQPLTIICNSDTNRLIFEDSNGLSLSVSVTLGLDGMLNLNWIVARSLWIMRSSDTK